MRPDVAVALDRLAGAARRAGISLVITSAYRSDAEQARLYAQHPGSALGRAAGYLASPLRDRARPRAVVRVPVAGHERAPLRLPEALLLGAVALRLHPRPGA